MILHYANLCVVAGGVDLFLLGSEMRGLEALRGPAWSRAGTVDADGTASWDYPFAAAMTRLADDVRGTFDAAGFARDRAALKNLVAYSADWSSWMGVQHADAAGQWPHLDRSTPTRRSTSSASTITCPSRTGRAATAASTRRTGARRRRRPGRRRPTR